MKDSLTLAHRLLAIRGKLAAGYISSLPDGRPVLIPRDGPSSFQPISRRLASMAWPLSDAEARAVQAAQWDTLFSVTTWQTSR
jgi:hypothetical protein